MMVKTKGAANVGKKNGLYRESQTRIPRIPHSMHRKKSWQSQLKKSNQ